MKSYSFIIPVYNCEKYIEKSINNVINIGLTNYELILIDDGSKDSSGFICDNYARKFSQVHAIHQKNSGVSIARNNGIKFATKDWIIFLDADDEIDIKEYQKLLNKIENEDDMDLVIFGLCFDYYSKNKSYRRDNMIYYEEGLMNSKYWINHFRKLYECNYFSPIWNKIYRKDILLNNCVQFREDMFLYEDLEFVFHYLSYCENVLISNQVIYYYRQSEDEGNLGRRLLRLDSITDLVLKIEESLDFIIQKKNINSHEDIINIKKFLPSLYLMLANEKIVVSKRFDIIKTCNDISDWYNTLPIELKEAFNTNNSKLMLNCKYNQLYYLARKSVLRHKLANWIKKNIGDFRKWKI